MRKLLVDEPEYQAGAACYRRGEYFEAHEHWEDLWNTLEGDRKLLVQGMIQVAAAWVKRQRGEPVGMCRLLEHALRRWRSLPDTVWGVDVERLRQETGRCLEAAELWEREGEEVPQSALPSLP